MNSQTSISRDKSWKDLLHFGDSILDLSLASEQSTYISKFLSSIDSYTAKVWLASPFYPLPGQDPVETLPNKSAPVLVKKCYLTKKSAIRKSQKSNPACVSIPLNAHDSILCVIEVQKKKGDFELEEIDFLESFAASTALSLEISRQVTLKKWRSDQLSLVQKVSKEIADIHDFAKLTQKIVDLIHEEFKYSFVAIFILDNQKNILTLKTHSLYEDAAVQMDNNAYLLGEGVVGKAAISGDEIITSNSRKMTNYTRFKQLLPSRSEVALPLKIENRVLGVLDIHSEKHNTFHEHEMVALRALADSIALAVASTELLADLQNRSNRLSAILEVNHTLNSILDFDELLNEIVNLIHVRFNYPIVNIFLIDPLLSKINHRTGSGTRKNNTGEENAVFDIQNDKAIIPWVARTGKSLLTGDISKEKLFLKKLTQPEVSYSELAVPLVYGNNILGVLDIQSDSINAFKDEDLTLIEGLASGIALSLRNASLYRSEKWRRRVADGFREVAGLISSNLELEDLLEKILSEIEKNLPCEASAIWLLDVPAIREELKDQELHLAAVRGVQTARISILRKEDVKVREWLANALNCCDPRIRKLSDPFGPLGIALKMPTDYSAITVPLIAGNQVLGILTLSHHESGRYGDEAVAMTTTHASYAAVSIQNARLFTEAQSQAWISTVLLQVSESVQDIDSADELLDNMARLSPMLIGLARCAFFLWDDRQAALELKSSFGFDMTDASLIIKETNAPAFKNLRLTKQPLIIHDPALELGLPQTLLGSSSNMMVFPMASRGIYLGAFVVDMHKGTSSSILDGFDDQTRSILQGIANQTAVALENINLLEVRQEEAYVTAVLLQVAQAVTSQNDLEDILTTIIHLIPILVGIETSILYMWNEKDHSYRAVQSYTGDHLEDKKILAQTIDESHARLLNLIKEQNRQISIILPGDAHSPFCWPGLEDLEELHYPIVPDQYIKPTLHAFPIKITADEFGILLAMEPRLQIQFHEKRLEILSGIAQQIALAIQNDRLKMETVERQRLDQEVQVARKIQITFLPESLPSIDGWQLAAHWVTARQVGGDFYDMIDLGHGKYGFVVADVSDKGIPAALYMTVTRTLIRAYAEQFSSPSKVLSRVNQLLQKDTPDGSFVTAVYCVLDTSNGKLIYTNAGHNLPYWIHSKSGRMDELYGGNMAMGVYPDVLYTDHEYILAPGDSLIMYTDGATDEFNSLGETYGTDHLRNIIKFNRHKTIQELISAIEHDIIAFTHNTIPSDDITLLGIRYSPYE